MKNYNGDIRLWSVKNGQLICHFHAPKPIHGEDIVAFPDDAKREAGYQLGLLQAGEEPDDWKPFSDIGSGVKEIRIHKGNDYRVMYVAKFQDYIYVLHAFKCSSKYKI